MAIKYNVYLDGNAINDLPDGLDELQLTIVREDGFSNTEQILRDNADTELIFWGDGYTYICNKRKENICEEILCSVEVECEEQKHILFEGFIKQNKVHVNPLKCIAKCSNLKDNSFSGMLRDYLNNEIDLYNTETRNCEPIKLPVTKINTPTIPSDYVLPNINAFDVLDVLNYITGFFTDNRLTVKSTFLQTTKYAIITGYGLHKSTGTIDKFYPKMSFEKLFIELRKKETLFMAMEYATDGTPYLRIEPESYFYNNNVLFTINDLPIDVEEKIDENRLYNSIDVGSSKTELQNDATPVITQTRLYAWNKENYIGCGGCSGEKDSLLNLVSDFIIDSNLIDEAMGWSPSSDYSNDDSIFLLNYYTTGGINKLVGNNTNSYNARLTNDQVLGRWVGISNQCIALSRFSKYGFRATSGPDVNFGASVNIDYLLVSIAALACPLSLPYTYHFGCKTLEFDTSGVYSSLTDHGDSCSTGGEFKALFTCQENGTYRFHAASDVKPFVDTNVTDDMQSATIRARYVVYADNTLTMLINSSPYVDLNFPDNTTELNFDFESPEFILAVGNVVMVEISLTAIDYLVGERSYIFHFYNSVYELVYDSISCNNLNDTEGLFKPMLTDFEYQICLEDYLKAKYNKGGTIMVAGKQCWIKQIDYKRKVSTLTLIHKDTFCGCPTL